MKTEARRGKHQKPEQSRLQVVDVSFVVQPDSDFRLKRVYELLLKPTNEPADRGDTGNG